MHGISFHIYQTPHNDTWTLSYDIGSHRHETVFTSKDDALQASYNTAAIAMEA